MELTREANNHAHRQGRPDIAGYWLKGQNAFFAQQGHTLVCRVEDSLLKRYRNRAAFAKKRILIVANEIHKKVERALSF